MTKGRRILVGKIDLDTAGAAYLLGVSREDKVEALRGNATTKDLANAEVVCIEVGGSGQTQLNNWDHHEESGPSISATLQVFQIKNLDTEKFGNLVDYINQIDIEGFRSLPGYGKVEFPTLSDVFAGMLLTERNPVEQLHKGVKILKTVIDSAMNPYGTIKDFNSYAEAKVENNRQMAKAVEQARWDTTNSGLKLGYLKTDFFGAPGALYGNGAEVVVAFSPHYGPAGVPKFTIAGNGIKVNKVLSALNALEPGWGGPPTGTILGSPREGSKLSFEVVVQIVKENL